MSRAVQFLGRDSGKNGRLVARTGKRLARRAKHGHLSQAGSYRLQPNKVRGAEQVSPLLVEAPGARYLPQCHRK